jgi:MFS family permease
MNRFKKNIKLEYKYTFLRNFIITHGIWLIYLARVKGFSPVEIGALEAFFHVSSLSMEIPTGIIADLYGRRLSRALSIGSYIIYIILILLSNNMAIALLAFFFCGTSYALESGSGEALVYDSLLKTNDENQFMKVSGNKEIIYQLSSSIAIMIGALIAIISLNLTFYILILVYLTALIPLLKMKETIHKTNVKKHNIFNLMYEHYIKSTKYVFSKPNLLFLIITSALLAAPITSLFFYFQLYLENQNYSFVVIGLALAGHSLFGALGGLLAHRLEKKYKENLILFIVPIFIVMLIWMIQIDKLVMLPFILLGLFDSIFYIVLGDYVNKLVPSESRATIISFSGFSFSIIMIVLFPLIGYIADLYTMKFAFMWLAIIVSIFYIGLLASLFTQKHNI